MAESECWQHSMAVISKLENLLHCGICDKIVDDPCVLGQCEHFFCQPCIADRRGEPCPICGVPSHVRDAQMNRQLQSAALLCQQITRLMAGGHSEHKEDPEDEEPLPSEPSPDSPEEPENALSNITNNNETGIAQRPEPSAAGFLSPPICRRTRKSTKAKKKQDFLKRSNETWGIGQDNLSQCMSCKKTATRKVVFGAKEKAHECCVKDSDGPIKNEQDVVQDSGKVQQPRQKGCTSKRKVSSEKQTSIDTFLAGPTADSSVADDEKPNVSYKTKSPVEDKAAKAKTKADDTTPPKNVTKTNSMAKTKKTKTTKSAEETAKTTEKAAGKSTTSPTQPWPSPSLSLPSTPTPRGPPRQPWLSPLGPPTTPQSRRSSGGPLAGHGTPTASPLVTKKNPKGETALQVACIKGDLVKARELISDGASVNTKDHAGWTPLHEACNHGHRRIAELLLDAGAMINVPGGSDNDTPLHDAISNQKEACVRLLVTRGASLSQRNSLGRVPTDLAVTESVKRALSAPINQDALNSTQTSLPELLAPHQVVVVATGLDRDQKGQLSKCAKMLHGRMATDFNSSVTHVVSSVNDSGMCPRTLKYLHAVLAGAWIVNLDWVHTCLEYQSWVPEEPFEVPGASSSPNSGAPTLGRQNRLQQLPGLFYGCHFYLSGEFTYPTPPREDLTKLLTAGGGTLVQREPKADLLLDDTTVPYHGCQGDTCSHFVVTNKGDVLRVSRNLARVSAAWVMDCIAHFKILDVE